MTGKPNSTPNSKTRIGLRVSIYPRGKRGIFVADFHHQGTHHRISLKTTITRLARQKATQLEYQLQSGTFKVENKHRRKNEMPIKICEASETFIDYHKTEGLRRKTVVKYAGILRTFCEFADTQGVRELSDVDLLLVDSFRALRQSSLSPKSMHHEGSLLKRFFEWSLERQLMPSNPLAARRFSPPRPVPRGGPSLSEINAILKAASSLRHPVFATAAFAGVRVGEIVRLRVEDVDFAGNWLHIVSRPGLETKSGQTWKVPLHSRLREILQQVKHRKTGWFFTSLPSKKYPLGDHHLNPKRVNDDFLRVLNSLGILAGRDGGYTFHSLRSSFKTISINAGVPREVVDVWQNHAPDRAASNVYYRLSDEESQRFMRLVPFGQKSE